MIKWNTTCHETPLPSSQRSKRPSTNYKFGMSAYEHDVGYKHIFSHKGTFLEFLRSFTKKEWAKLINEEDLILVDKSYVLSDFEEEESDILYKVNINGQHIQGLKRY